MSQLTYDELVHWEAYFKIKAQNEKKAAATAKKASTPPPHSRRRGRM